MLDRPSIDHPGSPTASLYAFGHHKTDQVCCKVCGCALNTLNGWDLTPQIICHHTLNEMHAVLLYLGIPLGSREAVFFGSSPMAIQGIRLTGDYDVLVSRKLWDRLTTEKPRKGITYISREETRMRLYLSGIGKQVEIIRDWCDDGILCTGCIMGRCEEVGHSGVNIAKLADLVAYKLALERPKDVEDIESLKKFLSQHGDMGRSVPRVLH